jgi:Secretion system C-terminal sorting domain/Fibronectin type III domain
MKNFTRLLMLLFAALASGNLIAQVSSYTFAQSTGTYTEITGGTVIATPTGNTFSTSLDNNVYSISGFPTFTFNGSNYTSCNVTTNGFLTFGSTAPGVAEYTPISSTTSYQGAISAWGGDLNTIFNLGGLTGEMRWENIGSEVVFQWKNFRPAYSTSITNAAYLNFQIRINTSNGNVVIMYGPSGMAVGSTNVATTRQVGLRGVNNTDYNNRTNTTSVSINASTAGATNSATQAFSSVNATPGRHTNGLTYTWTPPPPPSCGAPTTLATSVVSLTSVNLSWNAPVAGTPVAYNWEVRTSGAGGSGPTGLTTNGTVTAPTTSATASGLVAGTSYSLYVQSDCGGSGTSTWTGPFPFAIIDGDDCMFAIDLGMQTSPYNGTTVGAANNFSFACNSNTDPDLVFFIDVPNGQLLTIGQTVNDYDSENYVFWGGSCPGTTQIACFDDPDIQNITWSNTTGSTQRVYWIQDGFNSGNSGTFTLAWTLTAAPTPPDCATYVSPANGATNVPVGSILLDWDAPTTGGTPTGYKVFTGTVNPPTTLTATVTAPTTQLTASAPAFNTTYYWQVVPTNGGGDAVGCAVQSFTTEMPPPPPVNDDCSGAISLTSSAGIWNNPIPTVANTGNASQSLAPITCAGFTSATAFDVWYSFQTDPDGGDITFTYAGNADIVLEFFSGSCGSLTSIGCSDDLGNVESYTLTGLSLTGGADPNKLTATYYIRAYIYGGAVTGTFTGTLAGVGSALPIELKSFTGKTMASSNMLEWTTASERNVSHFELERSLDGQNNWKSVGRVAATGESATEQRYSFEDKAPLLAAYYRLRSVDFDAKEQLSHVVNLTRKGSQFAVLAAFPNPTTDVMNVQFNAIEEGTVTAQVVDITGRLVMQQQMGTSKGINTLVLNMDQLVSGVYYINLSDSNGVTAPVKVVKQ